MSWENCIPNNGSVWAKRKVDEPDCVEYVYGYTTTRSPHGHSIIKDGQITYHRPYLDLNPTIKVDKIIFNKSTLNNK